MGQRPMGSYHFWALLQTFHQLSIISCCLCLRLCATSGFSLQRRLTLPSRDCRGKGQRLGSRGSG